MPDKVSRRKAKEPTTTASGNEKKVANKIKKEAYGCYRCYVYYKHSGAKCECDDTLQEQELLPDN